MRKHSALAVGMLLFAGTAHGALVDGLQVYYSFDNDTTAAGGINDLSGNGRNASPFDANANSTVNLSFSSDVPAALGSGNSAVFSGDFVRADAYFGVLGTTSRTVSMWVKTPSANAAAQQVLAEWGTNANGERWTVRQENVSTQPLAGSSKIGGLRTEIQGDYRTTASAGPSIADGAWHHVVSVYDVSLVDGAKLESLTMYVDSTAVPVADNTASQAINTTSGVLLGIGGGFGLGGTNYRALNGNLDDVAIWNRALSASEVQQLFAGAPVPEPTTAAVLGLAATGLLARRRRR